MDSSNPAPPAPVPGADAPIVDRALYYAALGWPVHPLHEPITGDAFPCSCRSSKCGGPGKHPRLNGWQVNASTDPAQIQMWWTTWPTANIGIVTGSRSGICVLDIDPRNGGDVSFDALVQEHGKLPATVEAQTGGGGRHLLFQCPDGVVLHNRAGILPGIDFKGENGFIVVEPSLHKSGFRYGWEMSSQPGAVEVAAAPPWLLTLVKSKTNTNHATTTAAATAGGSIPVGTRNTTFTSLAGTMQRRGMSEEAIIAALKEENRRCVDDQGNAAPLDDEEICRIAASVARYEPSDPAAGGASAESAAKVCADYIARIQETGDAKRAFDSDCLRAAAEVRHTSPRLWSDLCDLLRAQQQLTEWKRAVETAGRQADHDRRVAAVPTTLPMIVVNDVQLRETIEESAKAVRNANEANLVLFVRDRVLVRLVRRDVGATIVIVTMIALYALLTKVANWFKVSAEGILEGAKPEKDVAHIFIEEPPDDLPPLQTVVSAPLFLSDGTLINSVGYHRDHAVYFDSTNAIVVDAPANAPTEEDVHAAKKLLVLDLLVDFPFETDADFAMAIGAFVLPFVRRMIDGCVPIHLFEAPTPGSGKTLIAKLISLVVTGLTAEIGVLPTDEAETRKKITALLTSSPQIIDLDNAPQRKMIDSPVLAAVATSETWTDRILGVSKSITVRNQALWIVTANNPRLSMELARRCIRIRVTPATDRPWERKKFKHPKIEQWTKQHRRELIQAIVVLVLNWIAKGKPAGTESLGSFENWAAVIGGILEAAGIPGFLKNQHQLYESADAETELWRDFTTAWYGNFGIEPQTIATLLKLCDDKELLNEILGDGTDRSRSTRLGKHLKSQRGRIYGNLRIEAGRASPKGGKTYRVVPIDRDGSTAGDRGAGVPGPATTAAAGTVVGDVSDVDPDVDRPRPPAQVTAAGLLTEPSGRSGPYSGHGSPREKKEPPTDEGLLFLGSGAASREEVRNVPPRIATPDLEATSDAGRSGDPCPPNVPLTTGTANDDAGRAPPHSHVCGSPKFVSQANGTQVCADCPRNPATERTA
jgi:bifunctional DNA primase/polymerase-like protein/primase-like protein